MKILGISLGDTSTAALLEEGGITAAVSEERFSRIKRDDAFPLQAIEYCLKQAGLKGSDLDAVAFGGSWDFWRWLTHYHSRFTIDDLVDEQERYWRPTAYEGKKPSWPLLFKDHWDLSRFPGNWGPVAKRLSKGLALGDADLAEVERIIDEALAARFGIPKDKIIRVDSHSAYAAYGYWSSPFRQKESAVVVMDANAADLGASVSLPSRFGLLRASSYPASRFVLGRIMRTVSLMLGLPPRDHDPALMALAAHAPAGQKERARRFFRQSVELDGLDLIPKTEAPDTYFYFLERLSSLGNEAVAAGLQAFAEDLVAEWVTNLTTATRARRLVVAGSLSMNHRIMARLAKLKGIDDLFVPPGAGEGALALGACYHVATVRFGIVPEPLDSAYLGPAIAAGEAGRTVRALQAAGRRYEIVEKPSPDVLARLLASGAIMARCAGRAEFGSRGLGNRSILCDPRSRGILSVLGAKIKGRESFVPFSPTLLPKDAARCLMNPKGLRSRFMNLSFRASTAGRSRIPAAVGHDGAVRPQILEAADNPDFTALLSAFKARSGVGALVNTSLNLRGEPMALTAADAARVFEQTSLDYLLLGDVLIGKSSAALRRSGGRRPLS